ncbi:MAG: hypothetical protein ACOH2N_12320 [Devosia sp.]
MAITPLETFDLTPRDELVQDIMLMLDEAATSVEQVEIYELAERIVSLVEDADQGEAFGHSAYAEEKPRVRVRAVSRPVAA